MHKGNKGVTLIELMVALAVFIIALGGTLALLVNQTHTSYVEVSKTKTTQGNLIAELVMMRDIAMAGMGMPKEYTGSFVPISSNNNVSYGSSSEKHDELIIKGPVISSKPDTYLKWGYNYSPIHRNARSVAIATYPESCLTAPSGAQCSNFPSFPTFSADTNKSGQHEKIVFVDAETKELLSGKVYPITGVQTSNNISTVSLGEDTDFSVMEKGSLIFSIGYLSVTENSFSNYLQSFTGYKLTSNFSDEPQCAPGTRTLIRVYGGGKDPVLDCVLDFQVEYGYTSASGVAWSSSPPAADNSPELLRISIVKQLGKKDPKYQYPYNSIQTADNTITVTTDQKHYHWRTIQLTIPLREVE